MNLFIGNLNPETTVSKLRPLFAEFGEIVSAKVIIDNATGMSRGFGFVEYADKFQALDAIDNLDATFFDGNIISVKEAKQSTNKPSGTGGRPGNNRPGGGFGGGSGSGGYSGNKPLRPRTPRPGGGGFNSNRPGGYNTKPGGFNSKPGGFNRDKPGGYNTNKPDDFNNNNY